MEREASIPRVIRVVNNTAAAGSQVLVSIEMDPEIGDRSVQFTLDYMGALSTPVFTNTTAGTTAFVNTSTVGKVSVLIGFGPGMGFTTTGFRQIATIQFNVALAGPSGPSLLNFSGSPTMNQVRDVNNNIPAALFQDGFVNVIGAGTPTPTATGTPAPTATATGTPAPTATATGTPAPTATSTVAPTATATATVAPTATATVAPTATATATVAPTATATATVAPTATATATVAPTATVTATATATATVAPTATATSTPGPATVQFSSATYIEDESQTANITITRTGDTSGSTTVSFSTSNGTATGGAACTAGVDYITVTSLPVTFTAGQTTRTVQVVICSDSPLTEPNQTVNLTLTGANVGTPSTAVLTINDTASQFRNPASIDINLGTAASPYPSRITVTGGPVQIAGMRVTLYDFSHSFPDNVDVLLVGPTGQKFIIMADVGNAQPIDPNNTVTLSLVDSAGQILPDSGMLTTGNFEPTSCEANQTSFPAPAPTAPYNQPGCAVGGTGLQTFAGNFGFTNANGNWDLFVRDDNNAFTSVIVGSFAGGWGLEFFSTTAANASISGRVLTADGRAIRNAKVVLTGNSLMEPRIVTTGSFGYYSLEDLLVGETYVLTVNSKRFTFQAPSRVVSLVDNVTDLDFVAEVPSGPSER